MNVDLAVKLKGKRIQKKGMTGLSELQAFIQSILFDTSKQPYTPLPKKKIASLAIIIKKIEKYKSIKSKKF